MGNKSSKEEKELFEAVENNNKDEVIRLLALGVSSTGYKDDVSKPLITKCSSIFVYLMSEKINL